MCAQDTAAGEALSPPRTRAELQAIAQAALAQYAIKRARLSFLGHSGSATFRVDCPDRRSPLLLKVHTHPRGPRDVLESAYQWLAALHRETDITVQEPVPDAAGRYVTEVVAKQRPGAPLLCSLVGWIEGSHRRGTPSWRECRPVPLTLTSARHLGQMVAGLHRHASTWTRPAGFVRPRYDAGPMHAWLRELRPLLRHGRLSAGDLTLLEDAAQDVEALMDELAKAAPQWGLVHADLCPDNYVFCGDEARPLDFDLCGDSYYMLDVAYAFLWQSSANRRAFLEGYQAVHPLPNGYQRVIEGFIIWGVMAMLKFWAPNPGLIERTCRPYLRGEPFLFAG
jgi:Ser/Thr protein kinase RdoA (MazF antagonist)